MSDVVTVPCARCGAEAARFSLLPPAARFSPLLPPGTADQSGQHRLQRAGFISEVTKFAKADELRRLLEMIRSADYSAAQGADADFVAFHCWACHRSYCLRCWRIGPPEFDEGFYDCTRAACPEGHEQIVDD